MTNNVSPGLKPPSRLDALLPLVALAFLIASALALSSRSGAWNSCGAFMGATLGVSTLLYLPYAVFCYASPALSVLYGFTGFKIERIASELTEPIEETS
jgi:NhaC family Na+:H+ antiporter